MLQEQKTNEMQRLENAIGTPSAQKIVILLVTWQNLTIKELITKTKLSKSQIHTTLKNLQNIELVSMITRGKYAMANNKFAHLLQDAYTEKIFQTINKQIYLIKQALKGKDMETANELYDDLYEQYEPLLTKNFRYIMSSLAHRFIEAYE